VHNNADQLTAYSGPGDASPLTYNGQGQATDVGSFTFRYNQSQQIKEASGSNGSSNYV
jgi:YD repeat-containing protein